MFRQFRLQNFEKLCLLRKSTRSLFRLQQLQWWKKRWPSRTQLQLSQVYHLSDRQTNPAATNPTGQAHKPSLGNRHTAPQMTMTNSKPACQYMLLGNLGFAKLDPCKCRATISRVHLCGCINTVPSRMCSLRSRLCNMGMGSRLLSVECYCLQVAYLRSNATETSR